MSVSVSAIERDRTVNHHAVQRRRGELGLSERRLAAACGVEPSYIRRLERGHRTIEMSVGTLLRMANALACRPGDLLTAASPTHAGGDAAKLGTILASVGESVATDALAATLGWSLQRTHEALSSLTRPLDAAGQSLVRTPGGGVAIVPALSDHSDRNYWTEILSVAGLSLSESQLLYRIAVGDGVTRQRPELFHLVSGGFVEFTNLPWKEIATVRLSDATEYALLQPHPNKGSTTQQ